MNIELSYEQKFDKEPIQAKTININKYGKTSTRIMFRSFRTFSDGVLYFQQNKNINPKKVIINRQMSLF